METLSFFSLIIQRKFEYVTIIKLLHYCDEIAKSKRIEEDKIVSIIEEHYIGFRYTFLKSKNIFYLFKYKIYNINLHGRRL